MILLNTTNGTKASPDLFYHSSAMWIICEVFSIGFFLFLSFLLITLIRTTFMLKKNGNNKIKLVVREGASNRASFSHVSDVNTTGEAGFGAENNTEPRKRFSTFATSQTFYRTKETNSMLLWCVIICVVSNILRCIVEQALVLFGNNSTVTCDMLSKLMIIFTALSLHLCHVFLWFRQLTFYRSPLLAPLRSKRLKLFSYAAYALMPVTFICSLALYLAWRNFAVINGSCRGTLPTRYPQYVIFGVLVASTVAIQIILSALFLYPLMIHRKKRKELRRTNLRKLNNKKQKSSDKLVKCIERVLKGATISITTDIVGAIVAMLLPLDLPLVVMSVLYNCNVVLNNICIIYTFANWREMLCLK